MARSRFFLVGIAFIAVLLVLPAFTGSAFALVKPQPQKAVLPNGLRVVIQEDHSLPLVSCQLIFKTGPGFGRQVKPGLISTMARLMELGAPRGKDRAAFYESLENLGCDKFSIYDSFLGLMLSLQGPPESLDVMLSSLRALGFEPPINQELIDRAKAKEITAVKQRLQYPLRSWYLIDGLFPMLFAGTPMGTRFRGNLVEVGALERKDFEAFATENLVSNNAALVIVGDVVACDIFKSLMPTFGTLTARTVPEETAANSSATTEISSAFKHPDEHQIVQPDAKCTSSVLERRTYMDIKTTQVVLGFPAPSMSDPDCAAGMVWLTALSSVNDSLLGRMNRRDFPKIHDLTSLYVPFSQKGLFLVMFESPDPDVDSIISDLLRKMAALWRLPPRDAELQRLIAHCISRRSISNEMRVIQGRALGVGELDSDFSLNDSIWAAIEGVTAEDLARTGREIFSGGNCAVNIALPLASQKMVTGQSITETLSNGMKVVVKPYAGSDVIGICLRVPVPIEGDITRQPGITDATFRMIEGQTNNEAYESEMARRLDEFGGGVDCQKRIQSGLLISSFAGREQYPRVLRCLKDLTFTPNLNQKLFDWCKDRMMSDRSTMTANPAVLMREKFFESVFGAESGFFAEIPATSTRDITLDQVKEFHQRWFVPGNVLCTIVGNVEPAEAMKLAREVFQDLPSAPVASGSAQNSPASRPLEKDIETEITLPDTGTSENDAYLAAGFQIPPMLAVAGKEWGVDLVTVAALGHLLTWGENGMLQKELVRKGLAEEVVDVRYQNTDRANYLYFLLRVSPDKLEACRTALKKLLEGVPTLKISPESIQVASKVIPAFFLRKMETSWFQAQTLASFLSIGYPVDFVERLPALYKDVKPELIEKAFSTLARNYILISGKVK
ncbi:MAG: insulinase family protein [Candidatus Ozemobacteraceae bacterium]